MTKPMRSCLKHAKIDKRVNVQGLRRSAEDTLRRLGVAGAVAEAVMGHGKRMRQHYSTVGATEIACLGPRMIAALGLSAEFVGDRVGDQGVEKENAQSPG
jgi:hypothetical protein